MSLSRRRATALFAAVALPTALAAWVLLPQSLGRVTVEAARRLPASSPDGSREPAYLTTPVRVAVDFSVSRDLEKVRERRGLGYVAARLAACDQPRPPPSR